jgi:hypothetical protein
MYESFMYLYMVKHYNYFGSVDKYFKELAKVFLELKSGGVPYPADNYQNLLNRHFFVKGEGSQNYVDNMQFAHQKVSVLYS